MDDSISRLRGIIKDKLSPFVGARITDTVLCQMQEVFRAEIRKNCEENPYPQELAYEKGYDVAVIETGTNGNDYIGFYDLDIHVDNDGTGTLVVDLVRKYEILIE